MERLCELTVTVGGYNKPREKDIITACMVEWCFRKDDFCFMPAPCGRRRLLQASAMGTLYMSEHVEEIVERLERAIWRANDGVICHVEIEAREYNRQMALETAFITEDDAELLTA